MAGISPRELHDMIRDAEETITVMVPSQDYYARRGDTDEQRLTYINPDKLRDLLMDMPWEA
jgi:hypothetical protein